MYEKYYVVAGLAAVAVFTAVDFCVLPAAKRWRWRSNWFNKKKLHGTVALVTGASRGVGKGIALGLAQAGATVYVTGRTLREGDHRLPGSLEATAIEISQAGGVGIPIKCDHSSDEQVKELFEEIIQTQGKIDILVNNVFQIPPQFEEKFTNKRQFFWETGAKNWDAVHNVGLRSHFIASCFAAPHMVAQKSGLIVNISSEGGSHYMFHVAYGVGKCATDRLAQDMAVELRKHNVAAISLWPGLVATERIQECKSEIEAKFNLPRLSDVSETGVYSGRAIAELYCDKKLMRNSGKVIRTSSLAQKYGVEDIDGRQPNIYSLATASRIAWFRLMKKFGFFAPQTIENKNVTVENQSTTE